MNARFTSLLLVSILLVSCMALVPVSTATSVPTATALPLAATDTPTALPPPSATPSPQPSFDLDTRLTYDTAGFSFQPAKGYLVLPANMGPGQGVVLHNPQQNFSLYVFGTKSDNRFKSVAEILNSWVPQIARSDPKGAFNPSGGYPITVSGVPGVVVNVTGHFHGQPLTGQEVALMAGPSQYVFMLGFSSGATSGSLWMTQGQPAFAAMVNSIQFPK